MIFSGELYGKVLDGTKTQTRRPCKEGEKATYFPRYLAPPGRLWAVFHRSGKLKWLVGRTYAVQRAAKGRRGGEKQGGRLLLKAIRREHLWEISTEDMVSEGLSSSYPTARGTRIATYTAFAVHWDKLYRSQPELQWHANSLVWVLEFELVKEGT